jgi:glycosyltransferase involved in cell wall biosynthesis
MKVAILGSRGIPNRYGGFEELAEKLAIGLANLGHEVLVYNPSDHPVKGWHHQGVTLVRIFNPENVLGSFGQFIYDFGASLHTRFAKPDVILELGYTSSSIWLWLLPSKSRVITNMDGLEWMRSKYSVPVRKFLKLAEKWAAKHSHLLIADNPEIEHYLHQGFSNQVVYIPYGADLPKDFDPTVPAKYGVKAGNYHLVIARMEPENHVAEILEGVHSSTSEEPILVVGKLNSYGRNLKSNYYNDKRIIFLGAIYDKEILNSLRYHSRLYFHGHSVGGTNPSLLEAMACGCRVVAHNNAFNRNVLKNNAHYFVTASDIAHHIDQPFEAAVWEKHSRRNISTIRDNFNWRIIVEQYEVAMQQIII